MRGEQAEICKARYVYGTRRRRSDAHKRDRGCAIPGEQRRERLVLGRRGHFAINRKVGQECLDLQATQFPRVPFPMEKNEAANPVQLLLLRAVAVPECAQVVVRHVEEPAAASRLWTVVQTHAA